MPVEEVIAGANFVGFGTTMPVLPGVQALGVFGSAKDGINANRIAGGPAFANLTNPPVIGAAWISVNNGTSTSTPTQGIDTNCIELAAQIASGWTTWAIARSSIVSGNATFLSIGPGQSTALVLNPSNSLIGNHPSVWINAQGLAFTAPEHIIDISPALISSWRMYALSYPAGSGARPLRITDVTGGVEKITTATQSRTPVGTTNHFNFGNSSATVPANVYQVADVAAGGVAFQPLTLTQLQTLRTWLLGVEALRLVTGF